MKICYLSIAIICCWIPLQGQKLLPIAENSVLRRMFADQSSTAGNIISLRNNFPEGCDIESPDNIYIESGETRILEAGIDTFGLDTNQVIGTYTCIQCTNSPFGFASFSGDTLTYRANENVQIGVHEFSVQYEDELGSRTAFFTVVVRRPGVSFSFPETVLEPNGSATVTADISELSGELACSFIADCSDRYEGRDQEIVFSRSDRPDNTFTYFASRYGGLDSVCLVLCNEVATCDTFNYAFRIVQDSIDLPLFDDFSYEGPFPSADLWLEDGPFVNRTMAIDPPSYGVATFDGVDPTGIPYGGEYGVADRLTSKHVNLGSSQGNLVILSYWLQRKGLGDKPEPQDSMVIEIKNANEKWVPIRTLEGLQINVPNTKVDTFQFYRDTIPDAFKYDGFQFRFKSYSSRTGILDNWHLDYVRLDDNLTEPTFEDIAFTKEPGFILTPYSSMPYKHFLGSENVTSLLRDSIRVGIRNFSFQDALTADNSILNIQELNTGLELFGGSNPTLFNGQDANIESGIIINRGYSLVNQFPFSEAYPVYTANIADASNFVDLETLEVQMSYRFTNNSQADPLSYPQTQANDFIATTTVFDNYFAYDDGTAEAAFVTQENKSIALQFTSFVEDSLRAVQFHFPVASTDISEQIFDLRVYLDSLNTEPVYEEFSVPVFYTSSFYDTLQGYSTYPFIDIDGNDSPIYLPAGTDFFISWTQITPCDGLQCIPVGYDLNSPDGRDFIFVNERGAWNPLDTFFPPGSLMLRPVVGDETPVATSVSEIEPMKDGINIFPNPTQGLLNIELENHNHRDFDFEVFNAMGQRTTAGVLQPVLDLKDLPGGVYFLRLRNRKTMASYSQRVVVGNER